jgi:hypothetical protein
LAKTVGYEAEYSPAAQERVDRLRGIRRVTLLKRVEGLAAAGPGWAGPSQVGVGTRWDLAACELRHSERRVYVHAVVPRREALRALLGEEIHDRWRRQEDSKLMHGRWY